MRTIIGTTRDGIPKTEGPGDDAGPNGMVILEEATGGTWDRSHERLLDGITPVRKVLWEDRRTDFGGILPAARQIYHVTTSDPVGYCASDSMQARGAG
jgi:hypothetical protein